MGEIRITKGKEEKEIMFVKNLKAGLKSAVQKVKDYDEKKEERLNKAIKVERKKVALYKEKTKLRKLKDESRQKYSQSWFPDK